MRFNLVLSRRKVASAFGCRRLIQWCFSESVFGIREFQCRMHAAAVNWDIGNDTSTFKTVVCAWNAIVHGRECEALKLAQRSRISRLT
jgi:hypothetical protein